MTKEITLLIFGFFVLGIFIFLYFNRHRAAFKVAFGVPPKKASGEMVNEEIVRLEKKLASYKDGSLKINGMDEEYMEFLRSIIDKDKKLAQKYDFQVPLEQK